MAWADVEWSNGDFATEAKMDQMQANSDYLREELGVRSIFTMPGDLIVAPPRFVVGVRITIGALSFETATSSSTSFVEVAGAAVRNVSIAALSDGILHHATISILHVGATVVGRATFYKHEDMNFLSLFGLMRLTGFGSDATPTVRGLTLLASRDNMGF